MGYVINIIGVGKDGVARMISIDEPKVVTERVNIGLLRNNFEKATHSYLIPQGIGKLSDYRY